MALFEFECKKCSKEYTELTQHDPSGKYKGVKCPKCGSTSKTKLISLPKANKTRNKMNNFGYRAGSNMERAQGERREAEAASHMGASPYSSIDDTPMDTGIHDRDEAIKLLG